MPPIHARSPRTARLQRRLTGRHTRAGKVDVPAVDHVAERRLVDLHGHEVALVAPREELCELGVRKGVRRDEVHRHQRPREVVGVERPQVVQTLRRRRRASPAVPAHTRSRQRSRPSPNRRASSARRRSRRRHRRRAAPAAGRSGRWSRRRRAAPRAARPHAVPRSHAAPSRARPSDSSACAAGRPCRRSRHRCRPRPRRRRPPPDRRRARRRRSCPRALGPDLELLLGRRPERVGGAEVTGAAGLAELRGELADRRRLAGAVDADDEDDRGRSRCRASAARRTGPRSRPREQRRAGSSPCSSSRRISSAVARTPTSA